MAFYQILYWQRIPSQIRVWDDFDEKKVDLSAEFTARIDRDAQAQGLTGTDEYLSQWNWGEEQERAGSVDEVAEAIKHQLEAEFPQ